MEPGACLLKTVVSCLVSTTHPIIYSKTNKWNRFHLALEISVREFGQPLLKQTEQLKNKQIKGYDFHRQKPINSYIVDFFCPRMNLAIEIDGESHRDERLDKDLIRQGKLESLGVKFLRFYDNDVKQNMEGVISTIINWIEEFERSSSDPWRWIKKSDG